MRGYTCGGGDGPSKPAKLPNSQCQAAIFPTLESKNCTISRGQATEGVAKAARRTESRRLTVTLPKALQPVASVTFTVYKVVAGGDASGAAILSSESPRAGVQIYLFPPVARS